MKFKILIPAIFSICALQLVSCKDHTLDEFNIEKKNPVSVSAGSSSTVVQKNNENITIRIGIGLSAPAPRAFEIGLQANPDTVNTLIANNTLQNTVALPNGTYAVPSVVNVPYGVDSAFFDVSVSVTTLERFYSKDIAMAVSLVDPTKGNTTGIRRTGLIVLKPAQIISADSIHYVSVAKGSGGRLNIVRGSGYSVTSAGVTIPLGINLQGVPGSGFSVRTILNSDTIATLVANGTLPADTRTLLSGKFYADTNIVVGRGKSSVPYELSIPWTTMDENLDHPVAVAIRIKSTTRHILDPTEKTVVIFVDKSVHLDNNSFIRGNGTGLKAQYYRGQALDDGGKVAAAVTRIDGTIDFGGWQPIEGQGDNWSSKWTGEFLAPVRGVYTFYQDQWDDGARLFIDGVAIINDFTTEWDKPSRRATITLERGQRYRIEAHHRENVGGQQAKLFYEVPSAGISRQIVPRTQLFPAP